MSLSASQIIRNFALLALGAGAGGGATWLLTIPPPLDPVTRQLAEALYPTPEQKAAKALAEQQAERKAQEEVRSATVEMEGIFNSELAGLRPRLITYRLLPRLDYITCQREYETADVLKQLMERMDRFDMAVAEGRNIGPVLRDAERKMSDAAILQAFSQEIALKCPESKTGQQGQLMPFMFMRPNQLPSAAGEYMRSQPQPNNNSWPMPGSTPP